VVWADPPERGHGREEHRSYKIVTVARGLRFPYADRPFRSPGADARSAPMYGASRWCTPSVHCRASRRHRRCSQHGFAGTGTSRTRSATCVTRVFDEDRSTVRSGHGPQVMATLRSVVIGLHRRAGNTNIAQACRRLAGQPPSGLRPGLKGLEVQVTDLEINNYGTLDRPRWTGPAPPRTRLKHPTTVAERLRRCARGGRAGSWLNRRGLDTTGTPEYRAA
jgi:hypothetical protein